MEQYRRPGISKFQNILRISLGFCQIKVEVLFKSFFLYIFHVFHNFRGACVCSCSIILGAFLFVSNSYVFVSLSMNLPKLRIFCHVFGRYTDILCSLSSFSMMWSSIWKKSRDTRINSFGEHWAGTEKAFNHSFFSFLFLDIKFLVLLVSEMLRIQKFHP